MAEIFISIRPNPRNIYSYFLRLALDSGNLKSAANILSLNAGHKGIPEPRTHEDLRLYATAALTCLDEHDRTQSFIRKLLFIYGIREGGT